jgi:hypothetical protein
MLHLFVRYTKSPESYKCSLDILTYIRDNIENLNRAKYYITCHKITDSMLKDTTTIEYLKTRGVEELPTIVNMEDSTTFVGVTQIKAYLSSIIKVTSKQPTRQVEVEAEDDEDLPYHEKFIQTNTNTKDNDNDGGFDEGGRDIMMNAYKQQLAKRPMTPQTNKKRSMPMQVSNTKAAASENIYEAPIGGDVKGGDDTEGDELLAKLMDNLGVDTY